jgi:hypothetical protein
MNYPVWRPTAERKLTELWLAASDKESSREPPIRSMTS